MGCAFHTAAEGSSQAIRPGHSLALSPASPARLTQTKLKPCSQLCRFRLPPTVPASSPDALLPPAAPGLQTLTVPCTREHKAPSGPVHPPFPPPLPADILTAAPVLPSGLLLSEVSEAFLGPLNDSPAPLCLHCCAFLSTHLHLTVCCMFIS